MFYCQLNKLVCSHIIGAFISLVPIIICELIGVQKLTNGFGLICMIRGVTIVFGPPLGGKCLRLYVVSISGYML